MKSLKWVYFIQLSNHMWDDGNGKKDNWFDGEECYTPENNVDFKLWDKVVKKASECGYNTLLIDLGDAVKYESHPEIAAPDALSKEELKKKLDEARSLGLTPIPKLNFSTDHHCWLKEYRRMVSSNIYRKVCVDLIDEVCELFDKPEFFHLGMDEEHSFDCLRWREIAIMRGEKLMFEDFGIMFEACRKNCARPWVWSDYFWNHPDIFERNMPKDVLQSNWFYGRFKNYPEKNFYSKSLATYEALERLGYDQIPACSTLTTNANPKEHLLYDPTVISKDHLLGYAMVPWFRVKSRNEFLLMNSVEAMKWAREDVFNEKF